MNVGFDVPTPPYPGKIKPLVSLGKMTKDIAKFVVIFFLLILSFTAGLCRLYHYYEGMVQEDATSGSKTQQVNSFINFESTLKTLFWALFCMSPLESADVIIENLPGDKQGTTVINTHHFYRDRGIHYLCL
ncbi:unnamed protein product [Timema podura]|uniref:Ion transport domain-containing protein n=1 Tax=Timema podura TaxID=61482 RepID=A0ABN7NY03_TIMPD|nr:unnamed protein product [Timema podura]